MAQKDFRSAKILFDHDADNEIVCFHCQQTLEKYLKGYLIARTGELQEGHNLLKLCKKAMLHDIEFNVFLKDMAFVKYFILKLDIRHSILSLLAKKILKSVLG